MRKKLERICLVPTLLASLSGTLLAQAPAAPAAPAAAPGPAPGSEVVDENGYKMLVPVVDPKKKGTEAARARTQENQTRSVVWQILAGSQPFNEANKTLLDNYYRFSFFANFSQTHDAALAELPEERIRLFRDHLERASGQTHDYLRDLVFAQMKTFVTENYHPAVRFNAMLVISHLNDVEATRVGSDKKTPEPMVGALGFIFTQFSERLSPDNSDAIRVAALIGLVRHLEWDNFRGPVDAPTPAINAAARTAIVKELLALAQQKDPPKGRSAAGHEWFRRRAIEGLTHVAYLKPDAEIAAAMETLLKDESESLSIRCAAATAIGNLAYQAPVQLAAKPTADELGYLALLACHKELTRVENLTKQEYDRLTRMQGGGSSYGSGGSYGAEMGGGMIAGVSGGLSGLRNPAGEEQVYTGPRPGGTVRPKAGAAPGISGGISPDMGSGAESGSYGYGGTGVQPPDPKQYRFDHIRRRIRAQLYAVETGLVGPEGIQKYNARLKQQQRPPMGGAAPAAAAPAAGAAPATELPPRGVLTQAKDNAETEHVKKVIDGVEKLAKAVESTKTELVDLDKALRKEMATLEKTIKRKVAVAAPPPSPASDLPEAPAVPDAKVPDAAPAPAPSPDAAPAGPAPPAAPAPMPAAAAVAVPE
jgi:hypothetical protein